MNLALNDAALPARLRFERPMTDDELFDFCAANEMLLVERDANGELILMSPSGLEGDGSNVEITTDLTIWAREDGRGLREKMATWIANGVELAWLIDPKRKAVRAIALELNAYLNSGLALRTTLVAVAPPGETAYTAIPEGSRRASAAVHQAMFGTYFTFGPLRIRDSTAAVRDCH